MYPVRTVQPQTRAVPFPPAESNGSRPIPVIYYVCITIIESVFPTIEENLNSDKQEIDGYAYAYMQCKGTSGNADVCICPAFPVRSSGPDVNVQ